MGCGASKAEDAVMNTAPPMTQKSKNGGKESKRSDNKVDPLTDVPKPVFFEVRLDENTGAAEISDVRAPTPQQLAKSAGKIPEVKKEQDPKQLKKKLAEREAKVAKNREREFQAQQAKLKENDEHIKEVLNRKKALGNINGDGNIPANGGEELPGSTAPVKSNTSASKSAAANKSAATNKPTAAKSTAAGKAAPKTAGGKGGKK